MNEVSEQQTCEPEVKEELDIRDQDDRYPGSYFRIPGPPALRQNGLEFELIVYLSQAPRSLLHKSVIPAGIAGIQTTGKY